MWSTENSATGFLFLGQNKLPPFKLSPYVTGCWGAEEPRSGHGTPNAASQVPKGREESFLQPSRCSWLLLLTHVQLFVGPPCLSTLRFPVDIWSQHVGLSGVNLAQMWYLLSLLDFTDFLSDLFFFSLFLCLAALPSAVWDIHPL